MEVFRQLRNAYIRHIVIFVREIADGPNQPRRSSLRLRLGAEFNLPFHAVVIPNKELRIGTIEIFFDENERPAVRRMLFSAGSKEKIARFNVRLSPEDGGPLCIFYRVPGTLTSIAHLCGHQAIHRQQKRKCLKRSKHKSPPDGRMPFARFGSTWGGHAIAVANAVPLGVGFMKLLVQPDDGVTPLVKGINSAKRTIDILIFRFDRSEIEAALLNALGRGVRVRALIASTNRGGERHLRALEMRLLAAGITLPRTADALVRYHGQMIVTHGHEPYLPAF